MRGSKLKTYWIVMLTVPIIALSASFTAYGDLSLSIFETEDGNLIVDTGGNLDWVDVTEDMKLDTPTGNTDDSFGQGAKEDTEVPGIVSGSIPPNKSDLKTFGVYLENAGLGQRYLHLYWTRVQDPSGTTNMDFEFNQSDQISANGVTPVRTYRDMLIQYDLANGGADPTLYVSFWEDGTDGGTASDCEASNKLPCWGQKIDLSLENLATGSINIEPIPAAESDLGALDARTFGEATIDFGAIADVAGDDSCLSFGSVYLKSRSSDSFTSALKDFIAPVQTQLSNCASLEIRKYDDDDPANPLEGAEFSVYLDDGDTPGEYDDNDTFVEACTTNASGVCKIENLFTGDYMIVETVTPAGYDPAEPQLKTIPPTGEIVIVEFFNYRRPATVTITKTDDDDPANLLNGAEFSLYSNEDGDGILDPGELFGTCTTGDDGDGICTIVNILPVGDYCLDETTTPIGYDKAAGLPDCFTLSLDEAKSVSYVNPRQAASVTITKTDDADPANPVNGAVFSLFSNADGDGVLDDGELFGTCTTVDGTCTIADILPPGDYCLDETVTPDGYDKAAGLPDCFTLGLNESKSVSYVNPRQPASVTITKTDDDDPPNLLNDAVFTLYSNEDGDGILDPGELFGTCTTGDGGDGICTIANILPAGDYCLDETTTPDGYDKAAGLPDCFTLSLNESKSVSYVNPRQAASVTVTKTDDADPANPVNGAVFSLFSNADGDGVLDDGELFGTCTTGDDGDGNCTISSILPPGDYCLDETTTPDGYDKAAGLPDCFTLDLDESKSVSYVNPRSTGAIKITKNRKHAADGPGDHRHGGVTFTITGGELAAEGVNVVTDENGIACYEGLLLSSHVGDYTVSEQVPAGYHVDDGDVDEVVSVTEAATCDSGTQAEVTFLNIPLTNITVSVDSIVDGGTASTMSCELQGGAVVASGSTGPDGDGSVTAMNLEPGIYVCTIVVDP